LLLARSHRLRLQGLDRGAERLDAEHMTRHRIDFSREAIRLRRLLRRLGLRLGRRYAAGKQKAGEHSHRHAPHIVLHS